MSSVGIEIVNPVEAIPYQKIVKYVMMVIILDQIKIVYHSAHLIAKHVLQVQCALSVRTVSMIRMAPKHARMHTVLRTVNVMLKETVIFAKGDTMTHSLHAKNSVRTIALRVSQTIIVRNVKVNTTTVTNLTIKQIFN